MTFATTKWELCANYKCSHWRYTLILLYIFLCVPCRCLFPLFCISMWALYLLDIEWFFSHTHTFIFLFYLLSFATLYIWSVQAKVLVPNVVNIKVVLLHVFCVCLLNLVAFFFFSFRWWFQWYRPFKIARLVRHWQGKQPEWENGGNTMRVNQEKWQKKNVKWQCRHFCQKVFRQLWFMCVINVWDWKLEEKSAVFGVRYDKRQKREQPNRIYIRAQPGIDYTLYYAGTVEKLQSITMNGCIDKANAEDRDEEDKRMGRVRSMGKHQ